jgi:hypothetical protein
VVAQMYPLVEQMSEADRSVGESVQRCWLVEEWKCLSSEGEGCLFESGAVYA